MRTRTLFPEKFVSLKRNSVIRKQFMRERLNLSSQSNAYTKISCKSLWSDVSRECKRLETIERLKGHSQLWDCADLDTTFFSLKCVYLNPKSNVRVGNEHVHQLTVSLYAITYSFHQQM